MSSNINLINSYIFIPIIVLVTAHYKNEFGFDSKSINTIKTTTFNHDTDIIVITDYFVSRDSFIQLSSDSITQFIEKGGACPTVLTNSCFDFVKPANILSLYIPRGSLRHEIILKINSIDTSNLLLDSKDCICNDTCPTVKNKTLYMSSKNKTTIDLIKDRISEIQALK